VDFPAPQRMACAMVLAAAALACRRGTTPFDLSFIRPGQSLTEMVSSADRALASVPGWSGAWILDANCAEEIGTGAVRLASGRYAHWARGRAESTFTSRAEAVAFVERFRCREITLTFGVCEATGVPTEHELVVSLDDNGRVSKWEHRSGTEHGECSAPQNKMP
jgi:hypothetical protein